jgi:hypothetical protein
MIAVVANQFWETLRPVVETIDLDRDTELLLDRLGFLLKNEQSIAACHPEFDNRDLPDVYFERLSGREEHTEQIMGTVGDVPKSARRDRDRKPLQERTNTEPKRWFHS